MKLSFVTFLVVHHQMNFFTGMELASQIVHIIPEPLLMDTSSVMLASQATTCTRIILAYHLVCHRTRQQVKVNLYSVRILVQKK